MNVAPDLSGDEAQGYALSGEIVFDTVQCLMDALRPHLERSGSGSDSGAVPVDLAGVTRLDSTAVALMLHWRREAAERGRKLVLRRPPASFKHILQACQLDSLFTVVDDSAPGEIVNT
ncbi:MAG: STAS domain-containing protein [Halothiobacillaceae bacterium]|nr:STAS domain-containing protein [Halothiobacillaceae bacterium]